MLCFQQGLLTFVLAFWRMCAVNKRYQKFQVFKKWSTLVLVTDAIWWWKLIHFTLCIWQHVVKPNIKIACWKTCGHSRMLFKVAKHLLVHDFYWFKGHWSKQIIRLLVKQTSATIGRNMCNIRLFSCLVVNSKIDLKV